MTISHVIATTLPASLIAALVLLALQGCADGGGSGNMTATGGTTNKNLLMHMGVSETSYSSRQAGGRG